MSPKFKFLIIPFLLFLSVSSCSRTKGYFSNFTSRNIDLDQKEPQLLASRSTFIPTQSSFLTPSLVIASENQSRGVQIIQASSRNSTAKRDVKIQKYLRQKEVVQTIRKFKAQNKRAEKKSGTNHWEPRLKIGVTLLVIGIVLSVFGLGLIGGISAFVGLLFTILGLLNTYY
jgi:hypothetical protein